MSQCGYQQLIYHAENFIWSVTGILHYYLAILFCVHMFFFFNHIVHFFWLLDYWWLHYSWWFDPQLTVNISLLAISWTDMWACSHSATTFALFLGGTSIPWPSLFMTLCSGRCPCQLKVAKGCHLVNFNWLPISKTNTWSIIATLNNWLITQASPITRYVEK